MNPRARIAGVLACALACAGTLGCAGAWVREHPPLGCRAGEQALVRDTLYFGRSIPGGGRVGDGDWNRFEHDVLLPAFPQGYSVLDAHGRWRGDDGATIGEDSRIVVLVHADDAAAAAAVRAVAAAYRERFRQESVLRERAAVCAAF